MCHPLFKTCSITVYIQTTLKWNQMLQWFLPSIKGHLTFFIYFILNLENPNIFCIYLNLSILDLFKTIEIHKRRICILTRLWIFRFLRSLINLSYTSLRPMISYVWFLCKILVESLISKALRSLDNFHFDRLHIDTNGWHPYQLRLISSATILYILTKFKFRMNELIRCK